MVYKILKYGWKMSKNSYYKKETINEVLQLYFIYEKKKQSHVVQNEYAL